MAIGALTAAALAGGGMKMGSQVLDFGANQITSAQAHKRNKEMQDRQFNFNSMEAQKGRDWQTHMSNTAIQRQMADMKSAGLNPLFAGGATGAQHGGAGNASGGSGGSAQQAKGTSFSSMTNASANSALQAKKLDLLQDQQEHKQTMDLLNYKSKDYTDHFDKRTGTKTRTHKKG